MLAVPQKQPGSGQSSQYACGAGSLVGVATNLLTQCGAARQLAASELRVRASRLRLLLGGCQANGSAKGSGLVRQRRQQLFLLLIAAVGATLAGSVLHPPL